MTVNINLNASLTSQSGGANDQTNFGNTTRTESTAGFDKRTLPLVLATDTALVFDAVSTPTEILFKNLGTNPVDIGPDDGGSILGMITLEAGQVSMIVKKAGTTLRALSALGTTLQITAYEA